MKTWQTSGSSLIGPYHVRNGTPNQDAYGVAQTDELTCIVAADGAGSLELSHIGSQLAVDTITTFVGEADSAADLQDVLRDAFEEARRVLLAHEDAALLGCTVAAVLVGHDSYAAAVVGDAFAVLRFNNDLSMLTSTFESEYANVTQFITSDRCDIVVQGGQGTPDAMAVATDGLENVSLKRDEPFEGFWTPVFAWVQNPDFDLHSLLAHLDQQDRIDDDTTLVVGVRND